MGVRVAVAGASGYAGGELLRLLASHPDLEIGPLAAGSNAGAPVTSVHPNLVGLADRTFGPTDPAALAGADLVFMALPHAEAAALAAGLPAEAKIVDLGAGFRLADPAAWEKYCPARGSGSGRRRGSLRPAATRPRRSWPSPLWWPAAWPSRTIS
jgi:N-acetyl-gamma-glutamyl-phosphate reductase